MLKLIRSLVPLALVLCAGASLAHAQSGLDVYFGVGTMYDPSSGQQIDTFGTGNPFTTPALGGAFGKAGADFMFTPHFGFGAETDVRFSQGAYTGLTYRPLFYDFNGIWAPTGRRFKRIVPEFQAGIGATRLSFYTPAQTYCNPLSGCASSNSYLASSDHFQTHLSAGVRFYVTSHVFVRPQIDGRWVNNFFQFQNKWVPEYSASLGWSFGEH